MTNDTPTASSANRQYGPGYAHRKAGSKFPGEAVVMKAGGTVTIAVTRTQPAERLYRFTGAGIFADSVAAGRTGLPIEQARLPSLLALSSR